MFDDVPNKIRWIDIFNPIGWLAFLLAALSLFLQRRDRKPRLKVEPRLAMRKVRARNDSGAVTYLDDRCVVIKVRNPTDKVIYLDEINWVPQTGEAVSLKPWRPVYKVDSHTAEEVMIPLEPTPGAYGVTIRDKTMPGSWAAIPTKGHFQIRDSIGNVFKSRRNIYDVTKFDSYGGYFSSEEEFSQFLKSREDEISAMAPKN